MKKVNLFFLNFVLVVGVIMLFSMPAVSSASKMDDAKKLFEQRADPEKAKQGIELLQKIVEKKPKNMAAYEMLSRLTIYLAMDLAAKPDTEAESYEYLGLAGEITDAFMKLAPKSVEANFWKAYSAAVAKDIKTALSYGEAAYKIDKKYFGGMPALLLGYLKGLLPPFMGGDKVAAYKFIDEAMEAAPDNLMIHRIKAMLLVGDVKESAQKALVHLQFVLESEPSKGFEPEGKRDKVVAQQLMGAYGEALKALGK
ncbi:MAG: hypothetical protein COW04_08815 [Deltaproteobacteria bacterium CG12_big_fil_rev_8_21_14_0_65_43_10]|nr:MAG: hypothetical protein AUK23_12440 [Deltaproteobacteria bacterium CG2_30_43_15]PIQ45213.1 MAG: hypothetical protein COW04_08815 [Deltaproteobacteria bacterium CG12_big_fil_rev_8_21_14_0_65_43_10]PIX22414.1 MAG: hypothetical protein COZ68_12155 [Deltaproteobacteria bacterium CG_4_8_14_3_um_filter_43_13]PIZ20154.1 MAG: hypothetical protein COY50_06220 [Deltaproteobacteria bacterium CG_4_10_14_0_8_um_filter_43_12]PJB40745.1 MAG: hypothetical protein CO106_07845 [Deltaproteobacteria bacterium